MERIDEQTVNRFMEYMGHLKDINKNIYAVAPALSILQTVVPVIKRLDTVPSVHLLRFDESNMTAHLMSAHTKEERIVEISAMNQKDRVQALAVLCRQGMIKRKHADHCYRRKI